MDAALGNPPSELKNTVFTVQPLCLSDYAAILNCNISDPLYWHVASQGPPSVPKQLLSPTITTSLWVSVAHGSQSRTWWWISNPHLGVTIFWSRLAGILQTKRYNAISWALLPILTAIHQGLVPYKRRSEYSNPSPGWLSHCPSAWHRFKVSIPTCTPWNGLLQSACIFCIQLFIGSVPNR